MNEGGTDESLVDNQLGLPPSEAESSPDPSTKPKPSVSKSGKASQKGARKTQVTPPPKKTKTSPKSAEKITRRGARSLPSLPSEIDDAEMAKKMACEKARQKAAATKNVCKKGGRTAKAKAKARAQCKKGQNSKKTQASAASRLKTVLENGVKANKEKKDKQVEHAKEKEESPPPEATGKNILKADAAKPPADPLKRTMSQQVLTALQRASTSDKISQAQAEEAPIVDPRSQHNRRNRFYRSLGSSLARTT